MARSEVEEHRQQNNNKASALAFSRSASQNRTKTKKNTILLYSWISSGSNGEAGMTEQQRLPWELTTPDQTLVAAEKRYLLIVPKPTNNNCFEHFANAKKAGCDKG